MFLKLTDSSKLEKRAWQMALNPNFKTPFNLYVREEVEATKTRKRQTPELNTHFST